MTMAEEEKAAEVRYLSPEVRSVDVPLKFPFAVGDREYHSVVVRRISGIEARTYGYAVTAFWRQVAAGREGLQEPLFPGVELPREAFAAIDADDLGAIEEAADRFFPDRLRPLVEALNGMLGLGTTASSGENEPAS